MKQNILRLIIFLFVSFFLFGYTRTAQTQDTCDPATHNFIVCENIKPGNPASEWDVTLAGDDNIQGFATDISVDQGQTVRFKVDTDASDYRLDIYRLGYYGGDGARFIAPVQPSTTLPQIQPACTFITDGDQINLHDCGNWGESASWNVPTDATSGIYIAKLVREDGTAGASHITFIVRDDDGGSDLLFQTSDTTWQAYNQYGGYSLYDGPAGHSAKVSYNRPFTTRTIPNEDFLFNSEYPMLRWLERNGYDVSYFTNVDADRYGAELLEHQVFLSVGHDEYWSDAQRTNVEAARDAGVHLAFFSGNEVYWKTRWENSNDGSNTPYRTLVSYKEGVLGETYCTGKCDPEPIWTGLWRDGCEYGLDGCLPENELSGQISWMGTTGAIEVPAEFGDLRFWRNTSIASLSPGETATLPFGTLGYEWDFEQYEEFYPDGRFWLSTTNMDGETHHLSLHRDNSGALIFGAGTVQWSWGLDNNHDGASSPEDADMQQATVNLLADMSVQPASPQNNLVIATQSSDIMAPTSVIVAPLNGATVQSGTSVLISGTATDVGGVVAGIEISVDGGITWQRANGRDSWSVNWTPSVLGVATIMSRAVDDSANIEIPSAGVNVTVDNPDDTSPPVVSAVTPLNGATDVATDATVTATFNEPINPATIDTSTFELRYDVNKIVAATVSYDVASQTATLTPTAPLTDTTVFTVTVRGGATDPRVKDVPGNALANDYTWSFSTTAGPCSTVPCTIWSLSDTPTSESENDPNAGEVGVKFQSDIDGYITGIRFYKGSNNTGTHIGNLWTSSGLLLATATFVNESPSGWQQVNFSNPVQINANTTYVASYHTDAGYYALDENYFAISGVDNPPLRALANGEDGSNGVYKYGVTGFPTLAFLSSNFWVDVVFTPEVGPDIYLPEILLASPVDGAIGIPTNANLSVVFNERIDPATINSNTFELRDEADNVVLADVTYFEGSQTAILDPTSFLVYSKVYTAIVKGGASDPRVKDLTGNALAADYTWSFTITDPPPSPPDDGSGGPILVLSSFNNPFSRYYSEILRAEGFNAFFGTDITLVSPAELANYDVIILGEMALNSVQITMLSDWVTDGGNMIAMRPDKQLAGLLGLTDASSTLSNAYVQVDTTADPGLGIVNETIQYHGTADLYNLNGAISIATLYSDASTATPNPAVTLRAVGSNGGQAAAFAYDLARSVVYTRQGNPAWAGQERDGISPIRSNDMYYGDAASDPQPDWVDLNKVAIPQADEQQRLLANMILHMNADRKPLPRFWYFPNGLKAVVIMTGDDHAGGGTVARFDQYKTLSPPGCSLDDWECVRGSSYIYENTPLTDAQAAAFNADGFEIGLHPNTGCSDFTPASLDTNYNDQLTSWMSKYSSLPAPKTVRNHCIVFSDWSTQPKTMLNYGMRLDTNYYYFPPSWVNDRPGLFTGSGMPMRFADLDGTIIDVYQAATQMTDESGQSYPFTVDTLLDRALGPEGYYGAFTTNMHTDNDFSAESDATVASAQARGVPIISSRQMLEWLDGRNGATFDSLSIVGDTLTFSITVAAGANNLQAMLPFQFKDGTITSLLRDATPVAYTTEIIKGVEYALFPALAGTYEASYNFTQDEYTLDVTIVGGGVVTKDPDTSPYYYGDVVTLTATANQGWTFSEWSGDASGSSSPVQVTMDGNKDITATFTQIEYTLDVTVVGGGGVTKNPATGPYYYDDVVTLTATADPGWTFSGWSEDASGSSNPLPVTIDGNKDITATFTQDEYMLDVTIVGGGGVTKNPATGPYYYDDVVTLTATADPGWTFSGWSGDASGSSNPLPVTMDGNKDVTATFTQIEYTLDVTVVGGGGVTKNPATGPYYYDDVVTLTATADPGWTFSGWSEDASGSSNPLLVTMDGNKDITATFTEDEYTLDVTVVGGGGVTKNPATGPYYYDDIVTLTATADPGWTFSAWSGDASGSSNPLPVTMDGNKDVTATFIQDEYTLDVTIVGDGQVEADPAAGSYNYGDVITLTATADPDWAFFTWSGDLTGSVSPDTYVIEGNTTITATFRQDMYRHYIPLVSINVAMGTPDLVVEELLVSNGDVQLVDLNQGSMPVVPSLFGQAAIPMLGSVQQRGTSDLRKRP